MNDNNNFQNMLGVKEEDITGNENKLNIQLIILD